MKKQKLKPKLNRQLRGVLGDNANLWIIARDPASHTILVGGLGGLGVGELWFKEKPIHASYPGYRNAPKQQCKIEPLEDLLTRLMAIREEETTR